MNIWKILYVITSKKSVLNLILILIVVASFVTTCALNGISDEKYNNNSVYASSEQLFVLVKEDKYRFIVCDRETRVMYVVNNDVFTLLVNEDGSPRIYDGPIE